MLYVYAITADHPVAGDRTLPGEGIVPGAPVRLLPIGDLTVAASPVGAADFGAETLPARLQDAEWTGQRVLAHQRVVHALLDSGTVVPMKFCTLFSGPAALEAALARSRRALEATLARVRGAREWGVKLYWETPPPAPVPAESGPGAGAAFFRRKRDALRLQEEAEAKLTSAVTESHRRLAARARAAVVNSVQSPAVHRQRGEMALNGAYLVGRADEAAFRESLAELERTYAADGIRYELTGPWGPYNFTGGGLGGSS